MAPVLRHALMAHGGFAGEIAFVATQTDLLTASEVIGNLGLSEGSTPRECALARNGFIKRQLSADFYSGLPDVALPVNREPPAEWWRSPCELPVFTVSSGSAASKLISFNPPNSDRSVRSGV